MAEGPGADGLTAMRRFGQVLGIRPERIEEYKRYHAAIWPEIAAAIREAGITNYSIFLRDNTLFAYFEYVGPDDEYEARQKRLSQAPRMQEWWRIMEAMQVPREDRAPGEWWATMEQVFFLA
jgi:L-rhamnose mutarotase